LSFFSFQALVFDAQLNENVEFVVKLFGLQYNQETLNLIDDLKNDEKTV
jgi:hypothetical protein